MPSNLFLNAMANGGASMISHIQLHNGNPGSTGNTNFITNTKVPVSYVNSSIGQIDVSEPVPITITGGTNTTPISVTHYTIWNGNEYLDQDSFNEPKVFDTDGIFTIESASITIQKA